MSNETMTLSQAKEYFLLMRDQEISPTTYRKYNYALRLLLGSLDNDPLIVDVTPLQLAQFRKSLVDRGFTVASVNTLMAAVRTLFKWLVEQDCLITSPARHIKLAKEQHDTPRAISAADFKAMLCYAQATQRLRDTAMMLFLLGTGCRLGGIRHLRFSDVDFEGGRARVTEKGKKGRWVYIEKPVTDAMMEYIQHERPQTDDDHVFVSIRGKGPVGQTVIRWNLDHIAAAAGVSGVHNPHSFRHAFSVMALESGANLAVVSRLLGHSDIATTARFYATFTEGALRSAHEQYNPLRQLL